MMDACAFFEKRKFVKLTADSASKPIQKTYIAVPGMYRIGSRNKNGPSISCDLAVSGANRNTCMMAVLFLEENQFYVQGFKDMTIQSLIGGGFCVGRVNFHIYDQDQKEIPVLVTYPCVPSENGQDLEIVPEVMPKDPEFMTPSPPIPVATPNSGFTSPTLSPNSCSPAVTFPKSTETTLNHPINCPPSLNLVPFSPPSDKSLSSKSPSPLLIPAPLDTRNPKLLETFVWSNPKMKPKRMNYALTDVVRISGSTTEKDHNNAELKLCRIKGLSPLHAVFFFEEKRMYIQPFAGNTVEERPINSKWMHFVGSESEFMMGEGSFAFRSPSHYKLRPVITQPGILLPGGKLGKLPPFSSYCNFKPNLFDVIDELKKDEHHGVLPLQTTPNPNTKRITPVSPCLTPSYKGPSQFSPTLSSPASPPAEIAKKEVIVLSSDEDDVEFSEPTTFLPPVPSSTPSLLRSPDITTTTSPTNETPNKRRAPIALKIFLPQILKRQKTL